MGGDGCSAKNKNPTQECREISLLRLLGSCVPFGFASKPWAAANVTANPLLITEKLLLYKYAVARQSGQDAGHLYATTSYMKRVLARRLLRHCHSGPSHLHQKQL